MKAKGCDIIPRILGTRWEVGWAEQAGSSVLWTTGFPVCGNGLDSFSLCKRKGLRDPKPECNECRVVWPGKEHPLLLGSAHQSRVERTLLSCPSLHAPFLWLSFFSCPTHYLFHLGTVHTGITLWAGVGAMLPESCGEVKWLARNQDSNPRQLAKCLGSDYWAQLPLPASREGCW